MDTKNRACGWRAAGAAAGWLLWGLVGLAQEKPAQPPGGAGGEAPKKVTLDDLPPAVKLGVRSGLVRQSIPQISTVVIVDSPTSYVGAIGRWTTDGRYPVLIDDGTWACREDIARFVRAFEPKRVVRWSLADADWPKEEKLQQALVEHVVAGTWGAADWAGYPDRLKAINAMPPGIVAASMKDPAWTAALALAAARGQLMAWVDVPAGGVDGQMDLKTADGLSRAIESVCAASGFKWAGLGDDVDAVTLCMHVPGKTTWAWPEGREAARPRGAIWPKAGEPVATTDLIGRAAGESGERMERWAWCGQVFGTSSQAAYRAMSAIFLAPRDAWFFDGYDNSAPWSLYDASEAAAALKRAGFQVKGVEVECVVDRAPRQGLSDWRDRAAGDWSRRADLKGGRDPNSGPLGCIKAGLIAVNTSGQPESFDLKPGTGLSADVPMLSVPAMVHFVHSWSAIYPGQRSTICGRWLEHGAYAYVGSVNEPYLQAFQPTPVFIKRMIAPAPLGAAARVDGLPPWRIAVIGDPLIAWGPAPPASKMELPMKDAIDLGEELGGLLKSDKVAEGFANLLMSARDADLVRLARAMLAQKAEQVTPEAALLGLGAAMRRVDFEVLVGLYAKAIVLGEREPMMLDIAWGTIWPSSGMLTPEQADLLGKSVRAGSLNRDVEEAGRVIRRLKGAAGRRAFLEGVLAKTTDPNRKKDVEGMLAAPDK